MVEGVLVAATYEALPFSISWTALAWHALLSVVWLWDVFPRWMMSHQWTPLAAGIGIGVLEGAWAITWWTDDPTRATPAAFAAYTAATIGALVAGFGLWQRTRSHHPLSLRAAKWGIAALAMWGTVGVFMPLPLAVPVAALLFGGSMRILKSRTHVEPRTPSYLSIPRVSATRLLVFGVSLASSAAITYTTAYLSIQTSIWVYVVTVSVSFWLLLRGLRAAKYSVPGPAPAPVPRSAM